MSVQQGCWHQNNGNWNGVNGDISINSSFIQSMFMYNLYYKAAVSVKNDDIAITKLAVQVGVLLGPKSMTKDKRIETKDMHKIEPDRIDGGWQWKWVMITYI